MASITLYTHASCYDGETGASSPDFGGVVVVVGLNHIIVPLIRLFICFVEGSMSL